MNTCKQPPFNVRYYNVVKSSHKVQSTPSATLPWQGGIYSTKFAQNLHLAPSKIASTSTNTSTSTSSPQEPNMSMGDFSPGGGINNAPLSPTWQGHFDRVVFVELLNFEHCSGAKDYCCWSPLGDLSRCNLYSEWTVTQLLPLRNLDVKISMVPFIGCLGSTHKILKTKSCQCLFL